MKAHNGGAIGGACMYLNKVNHDDYKHTSSFFLTINDTYNNMTTNVTSIINPNYTYTIYKS